MTNAIRHVLFLLLAGATCAALPLAAPAAAQDASAPARGDAAARPDDVVVVARRQRDKQIRDFVRSLAPTAVTDDPLARFDAEPLCPIAVGLTPEFNRAIVDRMRRVAAAAKAPLAKEDCRFANAIVLFVDDRQAAMRLLDAKFSDLLVDERGDDVRIREKDGPVAVWHVKGMVDRDGMRLTASSGYQSRTLSSPSRIVAAVHPIFVRAVVLIELKALVGLTTRQIADYAAMRAFTDADPAHAAQTGAPTILTALDTAVADKPPSLTAWDLAFLRGLYAVSPDYYAGLQRGQIGNQMKKELDKAGGGK